MLDNDIEVLESLSKIIPFLTKAQKEELLSYGEFMVGSNSDHLNDKAENVDQILSKTRTSNTN